MGVVEESEISAPLLKAFLSMCNCLVKKNVAPANELLKNLLFSMKNIAWVNQSGCDQPVAS